MISSYWPQCPAGIGGECLCGQDFDIDWDTQTANQAIGTGVLVGGHGSRFYDGRDGRTAWCYGCRNVYDGNASWLVGADAARIGFGAR